MVDFACKTISELRSECRSSNLAARVRGQADEILKKDSTNGKSYWELKIRDASDVFVCRAWLDTPAFASCEKLQRGDCIEIKGEFWINGPFGLDVRRWDLRALSLEEAQELFIGADHEHAKKDFACVKELVSGIKDPRLRGLCELFLSEHGERFQRAAAARQNHHAHRGGLLRHTTKMMRAAVALSSVYEELNSDLLLAGILFHDSGKLWEMCPPELGFEIRRELRGELLGHISIGIELANALWRKLPLEEWKTITPASEEVRLHLLHLIAAHHGALEFGSPVEPKTPESIALHFLDNLDARMDMIFSAYARQPEIAPGIFERVRPLNTGPVKQLEKIGSLE